jgi:hypothetical protein
MMIVDEDFLQRKFGDFEFAAEADVKVDYGVYITDYVADSLLAINSKYRGKTYGDLVGAFYYPGYSSPRMYINGIIKTDYKEKYETLMEKAINGKLSSSELYENPEFKAFYQEICDCLGYTYSLNSDFVEDFNNSGLNMQPGHYKLRFNGVTADLDKTYYLLGCNQYKTNINGEFNWNKHPTLLPNDWLYMQKNPEIPEGAKYMRVAFNDGIDDMYHVSNDVTVLECATLRFDGGEPIPKEIMNFHQGTESSGIMLNGYNGEIEETSSGLQYSFVSDYIEIPGDAEITEFAAIAKADDGFTSAYCVFYDENKEILASEIVWHGVEMEESTVRINYKIYNEIFGTEYNEMNLDTFVPHKAEIAHFEYNDLDNKNPLFTKEVTVIGLTNDTYITMQVSPDIHELFVEDFIRPQALYFDGTDGIGAVLDAAGGLNFEPQSFAVEGIHTMTKAVDVFVPIFELIAVILCVGVVFILMNFSSKMINDKMHEIGILKALGAKNNSIGIVFGLQVVLIAILTCVLATLGYYFFIDFANDVLIESLKRLAPSSVVLDLDFLTFKPTVALVNCVLVFALSLVSLIIPMIKIKAIKPVKIIKAKE